VPVSASSDFTTWSPVTDALPVLPSWAVPGFTWAPEVHQFANSYVLYFTAAVKGTGLECIGISTSSSPTGPFVATDAPFICQRGLGGSIDPRVFTAPDGTNWMLWKSDQNRGGSSDPTTLWSQRLSPDGLSLVGKSFDLMSPDEPWQGTIVEAPDMVDVGGVTWVFYSANWFNQPSYGIGVARCSGPQGPCADTTNAPLLATNAQGDGPGEASVFTENGASWLLYSPVRAVGGNPPRPVYITRIGFGASGPYLAAGGTPPALAQLSGAPVWSAP
jgi:beta-xylosidase